MLGGNSSSSSESLQIFLGISSCSEIVMHVHNLMYMHSKSYGLGSLYCTKNFTVQVATSHQACMPNCGD